MSIDHFCNAIPNTPNAHIDCALQLCKTIVSLQNLTRMNRSCYVALDQRKCFTPMTRQDPVASKSNRDQMREIGSALTHFEDEVKKAGTSLTTAQKNKILAMLTQITDAGLKKRTNKGFNITLRALPQRQDEIKEYKAKYNQVIAFSIYWTNVITSSAAPGAIKDTASQTKQQNVQKSPKSQYEVTPSGPQQHQGLALLPQAKTQAKAEETPYFKPPHETSLVYSDGDDGELGSTTPCHKTATSTSALFLKTLHPSANQYVSLQLIPTEQEFLDQKARQAGIIYDIVPPASTTTQSESQNGSLPTVPSTPNLSSQSTEDFVPVEILSADSQSNGDLGRRTYPSNFSWEGNQATHDAIYDIVPSETEFASSELGADSEGLVHRQQGTKLSDSTLSYNELSSDSDEGDAQGTLTSNFSWERSATPRSRYDHPPTQSDISFTELSTDSEEDDFR